MVVQRDRTDLGYLRGPGRVEPLSVAVMVVAWAPVDKDVDEPGGIDIEQLTALMGAQEIPTVGQEPDAPHAVEAVGRGQRAVDHGVRRAVADEFVAAAGLAPGPVHP